MSILKPRNRLINFRLTEEEFGALHEACKQQGARSVSDFARAAVLAQVEQPAAGSELIRIEEALHSLDARLTHLTGLLQPGLLQPGLSQPAARAEHLSE